MENFNVGPFLLYTTQAFFAETKLSAFCYRTIPSQDIIKPLESLQSIRISNKGDWQWIATTLCYLVVWKPQQ